MDELLALLPGRTWRSVKCKAQKLGLRRDTLRPPDSWETYTPEEDDVIRRYYAGEMTFGEFDSRVQGWINPVRYGDSWGLRQHLLGKPLKKTVKILVARSARRSAADAAPQ